MSADPRPSAASAAVPVVRCADLATGAARALAACYGAEARGLTAGAEIPGSYWGAPEAGLIANQVYFRDDTPAHSLLHELAHYVCMEPRRRGLLDTDAGGDDDEECAVCYLEIVLADYLPAFSAARCCADMDVWGYSFREGSAHTWFRGDGRDARRWLLQHHLIDAAGEPTWRLRSETR